MMRSVHALMFVLLLCSPALALAQDAASPQQPLEQAMTAEEFKAAGLDKLSPAELAALNGWLNRKIQVEATRAAELAESKVKTQARGFLSFGDDEPINTNIVGEFNGFGKGRKYLMANGQEWEQTDGARLQGVRRTDPAVILSPSIGSSWFLRIDGYNTRARVKRIK